jgi:hypothetical protein
MPSETIAELPVMLAAINLVMAIARLAAKALYKGILDAAISKPLNQYAYVAFWRGDGGQGRFIRRGPGFIPAKPWPCGGAQPKTWWNCYYKKEISLNFSGAQKHFNL